TVETVSLLGENYSARGLHDEREELWTGFELAERGRKGFMINQIIKSYTESKGPQEAIDFYEQMTKKRHVRPDAHTFIALYNTLSVNRVVRRDNKLTADDAVIGRQFFQDLVKMDWKFDSVDEYTYLPRTVL
ncbi:pentatricopeptide repeat-containing protein, partial [Escherichia coli]|nr:pentatricopeptide repeat-containing protein [Escherichia coli]